MALSASELSRVQYHMGYGNMTTAVVFYLEVATIFADVVQNNIDAWGENQVRTVILPNLDQIETDMMSARQRFQALEVEGLRTNPKEMDRLNDLYEFWLQRLEKVLILKRKPALRGGGSGGGIEVY